MRESSEEMINNNIEISNSEDWMKFNNPIIQTDEDPFSIEGEEILKVACFSVLISVVAISLLISERETCSSRSVSNKTSSAESLTFLV